MIKEVIAQGASVPEAISAARRELGVDEFAEVEVEVLEQPVKKTFGLFGGKPAKVRVWMGEPEPEPVKAPAPAEKKPQEKKIEKKAEPKPEKPQASKAQEAAAPKAPKAPRTDGKDPAEAAAKYLKDVLAPMGLVNVAVEITRDEAGANLSLSGPDISFIIGHRGETLDALQYLASLVANHVDESYYRITLDVGNYREKRKETLEALGKRMALRAVKSGRNCSLEPMNPYERRIIHTAVQTVEGAKSWSEGQDLGRHVVIGPVDGERPRSGGNDRRGSGRRNDRGRGGRNGYDRNRGSRGSREQNAPRAEGPKSDAPDMPIYGRIEVKKPAEDKSEE